MSDDAEQYARLMAHFELLLDLDPDDQRVELGRIRLEDSGLADTLGELLAVDASVSPLDVSPLSQLGPPLALPPRYRDLGPLGAGGMGEVRRVFDQTLGRVLAMKIVGELHPALEARFTAEAHVLAQLQHPGIVPIHELGRLPDGRSYFTMREVVGETWAETLRRQPPDAESRRAGIYILRQVALALAFAHEQGVVHRDLKPSNIMLGPFGDVMVLDWGLARRLDEDARRVVTASGTILGTPAYMAPEQALGLVDQIGPATDVYTLGAILYHLLAGHPVRGADAGPLGALVPAASLRGLGLPVDLVDLCERSMAIEPADRPPDAGPFAETLSAWLSGAADRERARLLLAEAVQGDEGLAAERERLVRLRQAANARLAVLAPHASLAEKRPAWALDEEARALAQALERAEASRLRRIHAALNLAPDLAEARALLADHHQAEAEAAERRGDAAAAARHREDVAHYDDGRHARWLEGAATLRLTSDPPGATATLLTWETRDRQRIAVPGTRLGATPFDATIPAGNYLIQLDFPDRPPARLALALARLGQHTAHVDLPAQLPQDAVQVPGGPFLAGGDPDAPDGFAPTVVDVPGFLLQRQPVTNRDFIAFLDALVDAGREEEALAAAPREMVGGQSGLVYRRDTLGHFRVGVDADGVTWSPDHPVVQISWRAAMAYAAWWSERTGLPWRLPHELEWEKAARGVDGRAWPWGDAFDPAFAASLHSLPGPPRRQPISAFPTDVSPYGVRGLGGNVRDWCLNCWTAEPPPARLVVEPPDATDPRLRSTRGGSYVSLAPMCRAAT
ncbi:MAG: bifunctional serine/threonine-protein kinase/formylglycine-generating enzyme family protein [bacterium]